jgi:hypothetical protein
MTFVYRSISSSKSCGKRARSLSECNADMAGSSREWRLEGAPTTDEVLHILLHTKGLSVVVLSVVVCPLQRNILK